MILEISTMTDQTYRRFLKMCKAMEHADNMSLVHNRVVNKFSKISCWV